MHPADLPIWNARKLEQAELDAQPSHARFIVTYNMLFATYEGESIPVDIVDAR